MFFSFSQASLNIFSETHKANSHRKFQLCMVFLWLLLFLAVMAIILFWMTGVCGVSLGGGAKATETMEMTTRTTTLASVSVMMESVTQVGSVFSLD